MADPGGGGGGNNNNNTPGGSTSTPGSGSSTPRAIASLAKKQADVTRLGTQKLKFVPTLPVRRKKEDVKQEQPTPPSSSKQKGRAFPPSSSSRGGGGNPPPRGRARTTLTTPSTRPPLQEMTASGPFAMGPALATSSSSYSSSSRRIGTTPRSNFSLGMVGQSGGVGELGKGLTGNAGVLLGGRRDFWGEEEKKKKKGGESGKGKEKEEEEVYSDPDEGVEIVDMENVRSMDWMAPESLRREKSRNGRKKKKREKVKREVEDEEMKDVTKDEGQDTPTEQVNLANAVHLSDSEDEEEIEDITNDFTLPQDEIATDTFTRQEHLYFFQFPLPFPTFQSKQPPLPLSTTETSDLPSSSSFKKVSFTEDTKPPASTSRPVTPSLTGKKSGSQTQQKVDVEDKDKSGGQEEEEEEEEVKVDGIVGQLEVYQSGAVKMRFGNGIVYDIVAATQPSFLQHAVYLDTENKNLCVLGEVNRRFVASPDIGVLLSAMEVKEKKDIENMLDDVGLIRMDTT